MLAAAATAYADFVRGSIKIDVRDGGGKPREAEVSVRGPKPEDGDVKVARLGDVYVADGLVDGDYTVAVGAATQTVHVEGRQDRGVVFVVGGKPAVMALGPRETACDAVDGKIVEAVAFARGGGLGAGRLDVRNKQGKVVCSAIVAGGAATLRLVPGAYQIVAKFVGGSSAAKSYFIARGETPAPLMLRAK